MSRLPRLVIGSLAAFAALSSAALSSPFTSTSVAATTPSAPVRFTASNRDGSHMTCDQFRKIQRNGSDDRGWNDALLQSATLEVIEMAPIDCAANTFTIRRSGVPGQALSFAWPSPRGYSTAIVDLPSRAATFTLEFALAEQAVRDSLATRGALGLPANPALTSAMNATRKATGVARVRKSWALFDAATVDVIATLESFGARNSRGWRGVTFDRPRITEEQWRSAERAVGTGGWIRLVLDLEEELAVYGPLVDRTHQSGLKVMGQILDSSQMKQLDVTKWKQRVESALTTLPSIDGWEIGNEVNGEWLGDQVPEKVAYAAQQVRARAPGKPTVLTLLWTLGESSADDSMFSWLRTLDTATVANVDVVGLSVYPEDHPLGSAYDRVVRTLRKKFPNAQVSVTELGYGNDDLGRVWWWGSPTDMPAGRKAVARFYDAASRAHSFGGGGTFWWSFLAEGDVR